MRNLRSLDLESVFLVTGWFASCSWNS